MNRLFFIAGLGALILFGVITTPPWNFPSGETVIIPHGATGAEAMRILRDAHVIASPEPYLLMSRLFAGEHGVRAGGYIFERPMNALVIASRVSEGGNAPAVKVTLPEGTSVREMAELFEAAIPGFEREEFITAATPHEGYLFPDTYFFVPGVAGTDIVAAMRSNFDTKIKTLDVALASSTRTREDVVIMASLLEKEARLPETRRVVAGILWKRLDQGIRLQVDAVFGYIFATSTFSPSFDQLSVMSPYNTYLHAGLPPGPIGNPGLGALQAALEPTASPYLYYLTGADGRMHYARTFDEHVANRRYLR